MIIKKKYVLGAAIILITGAPAFGSEGLWTDNGRIICNAGRAPYITSDGLSNAIIVWHDDQAGNYDIYAQKLDHSGNSIWTENGIVICNYASVQDTASIAPDGAGGVVIVWEDSRNGIPDIYAQKIDGDGNSIWAANGVVVCNEGCFQWHPCIAPDGAGGAIIVWEDTRNDGSDLYAQRIDSSGSSVWTENGMVICNKENEQRKPAIIRDGAAGAIIIWKDNRDGNYDIYAQRIDSSGSNIWTENGRVICNEENNQGSPSLSPDGSENIIMAWHRKGGDGKHDIYAQKINNSGSSVWTENGIAICNEENDQGSPSLSSDNSGGAIIAWGDNRNGNYDIFAQRINSAGQSIWAENGMIICNEDFLQYDTATASDGAGGAIIVWQDERAPFPGIYAQRIIRPKPQITGFSPPHGAWGEVAGNIHVSGEYFQDDWGAVTYIKLTRSGEDDIAGMNLRSLSANSFTCDFDLSPLSAANDWFVVICDSFGQTGTSSALFTVCAPRMRSLSWVSAQAGSVNTGTQNNLAGQINCAADGYDFLQSLAVENKGTAEAGVDIIALNLWHKTGGGMGGLTFDPLTADSLGNFQSAGPRRWTKSFGTKEVKAEDKAALYITADIGGGAQVGRTCRFSLPAHGAVFAGGGSLPESELISGTEQVITKSASFYLDFFSLAPVNVAEAQKAVRLGRIKIGNAAGSRLEVKTVLISLRDKAGKEWNLSAAFDRIWMDQEANRAAEMGIAFNGNEFTFTPPLCLEEKQEAVLELAGDIKNQPGIAAFFIGIPHGQCINSGVHLSEPVPGKEFPLLSGQVNIRAPDTKTVFSNYPNPFVASKESTKISYYLKLPGRVKIAVLSISGKLVKTLVQGDKPAGMQEAEWDGRNERGRQVVSGAYLLRLDIRYADGSRERLIRKVGIMR